MTLCLWFLPKGLYSFFFEVVELFFTSYWPWCCWSSLCFFNFIWRKFEGLFRSMLLFGFLLPESYASRRISASYKIVSIWGSRFFRALETLFNYWRCWLESLRCIFWSNLVFDFEILAALWPIIISFLYRFNLSTYSSLSVIGCSR